MSNEVMNKVYEQFLEEVETPAPEYVRSSYRNLNRANEEYWDALQRNMFEQAFQFGYIRGMEKARAETKRAGASIFYTDREKI